MRVPFFSVIVPIYKVEAYLAKCIDSILSQTFCDFELILVNDGSPDFCPQICDDYAKKDNRIRVIHKINGGLSDARNCGLTNMTIANSLEEDKGYVIFIDGDDYFCNVNTFQQIYDRIKAFKEEFILYGCKTIREDNTEEISRSNYPMKILNRHNKSESLEALFKGNLFPGSAWIFTVKRTLIKKNNLKFTKGITAEDYEWIISNLILCNNIGAIDGIHYAYIKRNDSITSTTKISGFWGLKVAIEKYYSYHKEFNTLNSFLSRIYLLFVMSYNNLPNEKKDEAKYILKKYMSVLKASKNTFQYYFIRVFGLRFSSWIIYLIYKIIR